MSGRQETIRLFRSFLVLRHQYPNKQGRSKLRRWTNLCFSLKQLQYDRIAEQRGAPVADKEAAKWRVQADNHLDMWSKFAEAPEEHRRQFIDRVLMTKNM